MENRKNDRNTARTASADAMTTSGGERRDKRSVRGDRPRGWSAFDIMILVLVCVAIAGIGFRLWTEYGADKAQDAADANAQAYVIYFDVEDVYSTVIDNVEAADEVYLYEGDYLLGYFGRYEDGSVAFDAVTPPASDEEAETDVRLVDASGCIITAIGEWDKESECLILRESGLYLAPGSVIKVRTERVTLEITITKILQHN